MVRTQCESLVLGFLLTKTLKQNNHASSVFGLLCIWSILYPDASGQKKWEEENLADESALQRKAQKWRTVSLLSSHYKRLDSSVGDGDPRNSLVMKWINWIWLPFCRWFDFRIFPSTAVPTTLYWGIYWRAQHTLSPKLKIKKGTSFLQESNLRRWEIC
jgi:hypothetical protein